jgi:hypothetical protein
MVSAMRGVLSAVLLGQLELPGLNSGLVSPGEVERMISHDLEAVLVIWWGEAVHYDHSSEWKNLINRLGGASVFALLAGYSSIHSDLQLLLFVATSRESAAVVREMADDDPYDPLFYPCSPCFDEDQDVVARYV